MYYVNLTIIENGEKIMRQFDTKEKAIYFFKSAINKYGGAVFGFISDDEALSTAEEIKEDYDGKLALEHFLSEIGLPLF